MVAINPICLATKIQLAIESYNINQLEWRMTLLTEGSIPQLAEHPSQTMEEYSAAIADLNLQGYQLSKGNFNGHSKILSTDGFKLIIRSADTRHLQIGQVNAGHIAMIFPLKKLTYLNNGRPQREDSQLIRYNNTESKIICPKGHKHLTLLIRSKELVNYLNEDEIELFFNTCKHLYQNKISIPRKLLLTEHLCHLYKTFKQLLEHPCSLLAYQDCYDSLFYAVNDYHLFHSKDDPIKITNRERLLARALDYIHHSDLQTLTVSNLIKGTHASSRSIQYCFSELLGMTAKNYLIRIRLNAIRSELLQSSPTEKTITQVANKFGVVNIGRFKQDYQSFFDETPRETLKQT